MIEDKHAFSENAQRILSHISKTSKATGITRKRVALYITNDPCFYEKLKLGHVDLSSEDKIKLISSMLHLKLISKIKDNNESMGS